MAPTTLLSSISSMEAPGISFDELIMEAIGIMKEIPPSRIVRLRQCAKRPLWFSRVKATTDIPPTVTPLKLPRMLQEPPFWAVRAVVERSGSGSAALGGLGTPFSSGSSVASCSRHRRHPRRRYRSRSRSTSAPGRSAITAEERLEVQGYLQKHADSIAVVAAGYGSGRTKSNKRVLGTGTLVAAAAVVALAAGVAAYCHLYNSTDLPDREKQIDEPAVILAASSLVDSLELGNDTGIADSLDLGQCMITWSPADDRAIVPSQQPSTEASSPVVMMNMLVPLSPHDHLLADFCHYEVLVATTHGVLVREFEHVHQVLLLLAASVVKPVMLQIARYMEMQVIRLESTARGRHVLASYREAKLLMEQGRVSAASQLRGMLSRMNRSVKALEGTLFTQLLRAWQFATSPTGVDHPLAQACRVAAAHPVVQKFVETSVVLLLEASFTNFYV